jgi:hypothetical protein
MLLIADIPSCAFLLELGSTEAANPAMPPAKLSSMVGWLFWYPTKRKITPNAINTQAITFFVSITGLLFNGVLHSCFLTFLPIILSII